MPDVILVNGMPVAAVNFESASLDLKDDQAVSWVQQHEVSLSVRLPTTSDALPDYRI
jgi:hypothetical protein